MSIGTPADIERTMKAVRRVMDEQNIPPGPRYMTVSHETAMEQFGFTRDAIALHKRQNKKLHKGTRGVLMFRIHET